MTRSQAVVATIFVALYACWTGAAAQPAGQGQRDQKAADAMEKARLKAEAQPVQAYIPPPKPEAAADAKKTLTGKPKKPEVFTATVPAKPGDKPAKKGKKKAKQDA